MMVSVIVPLYNKAAYVERAVESALSQAPAPDEVLVIDDGSTDDGLARLERFAGNARLRIVRQNNAGEGAARNRGLAEMRGELAAFLDADDEWLPGHLADLLELRSRFPEAGILATGFRTVNRKGVVVETTMPANGPAAVPNYFQTARGAYFLHISSCAVSKRVSDDAGGFAEREAMGADLEFYARVSLRHPMAYHPRVSGIYYAAIPGSAVHAKEWNSQFPPVVRFLRAALADGEVPREVPRELAHAAREYADWVLAEHAVTGVSRGHRRCAAAILAQVQPRQGWPFGPEKLVRLGLRWLPLTALRTLIRLRRSRYSLVGARARNGVVQRVLHADA
jgi:glycosyltransferase involved in cell wall biosynthesis